MKRRGLILIFLILINISLVYSGSVGISPAKISEHFEPYKNLSYDFIVYRSGEDSLLKINLIGETSKYTTLSKDVISSNEGFTLTINLPKEMNKPGPNILIVEAIEHVNSSDPGGMIGGVTAVRAPIKIFVPYPGVYLESSFKIDDINNGENANIEIESINLGSENVIVKTNLTIHSSKGEEYLTEVFEEKELDTKNTHKINKELDTKDLIPGDYIANVIIEYGEIIIRLNKSFRVGQFKIDIVDYDYQFQSGEINPFTIKIENKWNSKIENIFAEIEITDESEILKSFKTVSTDTNAWEEKNITGYFDTGNLSPGRYLANIRLLYKNSTTSKLVAVYILDPPKEKDYKIYLILGGIVGGLLLLIILIYFIFRIKELKKALSKKRNGKKTIK